VQVRHKWGQCAFLAAGLQRLSGLTVGCGSISAVRPSLTSLPSGLMRPAPHPEVRAKRASKGDGPNARAAALRGPLRGHLRMTGNGRTCAFSQAHPRPSFAKHRHVEVRSERREGKRRGGACLLPSATPTSPSIRKGSGTPTDALVLMPCCWHGRASSRMRTSIGVPPRFWPRRDLLPRAQLQATFPGTWNWRRSRNDPHSRGGTRFYGRYPPSPVPVQRAPRAPVGSAGRLMPEAARERFATPPAGTALAPMPRLASGAGPLLSENRKST
jgi:hypothetical protein